MLHCRMQQVKSDWKEVSAIKPSLSKVIHLSSRHCTPRSSLTVSLGTHVESRQEAFFLSATC